MTEKLRILLAEDSPINQIILKAILSKAGHTLEIVNNGLEAVTAASRTDFDLILMDVQMPEMNGVSATQAIRALPPPQSTVPIIALTANAMREQQEEYLAAGMDDYVSKPFTEESLLGVIARLHSSRRLVGERSMAREASVESAQWEEVCLFDEAQLGGIRQCVSEQALHDLLAQLSEAMTEHIEQLRSVWQSGDMDQISKIAHRLKGEAGALGIQRVAAIAGFLNKITEPAAADEAIRALEQAYRETLVAMQARNL